MPDRLMDDGELWGLEQNAARVENARALLSTVPSQAVAELEELANGGSVMAMLFLAAAHNKRGEVGWVEAEKWYRMAYRRGSSTALFCLGTKNYHAGNIDEAERLWTDGVSRGDGPSMFCLASLYLDNSSDAAKHAQAKILLEEASALGQVRAAYRLGRMSMAGKFGVANIPKGALLCLKSLISAGKIYYREPMSPRLW